MTPLVGADGEVYAVAQGAVAIAGFQAEGQRARITRGVPTVGRVSNGAIVEREVNFAINRLTSLRLALRNPDLTTARRIAAAINDFIGSPTAEPTDPGTVHIKVPRRFEGNIVSLLTEIEQLRVQPDSVGESGDRRGLRHHRHGQGRARLHGGDRAGQPHRLHLRAPAGEPARPVRARARRS